MEAGRLRHRIELQSPSGSRDAVGERVTVWTVEEEVWAEVKPLTGREQFIAAQQQASTTHLITIRYTPRLVNLNASWRVRFKDRFFTIEKVKNIEERNVWYEIECTEGLRVE